MEFLVYPLFVALFLPQLASAFAYMICSAKGGPCKLEDYQQLVHTLMDQSSNYLYSAYLSYCRHVCSVAHKILETWNKIASTSPSVSWYQKFWNQFVTPLAIRLGLQRKKEEYIEEIVCKSSAPGLAILFSLGFCALAFYLSRKPKRTQSTSKLDLSAYCRETEEDEGHTNSLSTLINNYDQRSCCGCKMTISDISEHTESAS